MICVTNSDSRSCSHLTLSVCLSCLSGTCFVYSVIQKVFTRNQCYSNFAVFMYILKMCTTNNWGNFMIFSIHCLHVQLKLFLPLNALPVTCNSKSIKLILFIVCTVLIYVLKCAPSVLYKISTILTCWTWFCHLMR